jgi:hypothetical protein
VLANGILERTSDNDYSNASDAGEEKHNTAVN